MTTPPVRLERRVGQRFSYLLPVSLRDLSTGTDGLGFTQDLSSRGVFLFTDAPLCEGASVELTLKMPSEITLGDSMRVRCRGHVLRVVKRADQELAQAAQTKIGVAVRLEGYEYLTESAEDSASFPRVDALHTHREDERPAPVGHSAR